jgi:hypothetical protein
MPFPRSGLSLVVGASALLFVSAASSTPENAAAAAPTPLGLYQVSSAVAGLYLTTCEDGAYAAPLPPPPPFGYNESFVLNFTAPLDGDAGAGVVSIALLSSSPASSSPCSSYLTVTEGGRIAALPLKDITSLQNASFVIVPGLADPTSPSSVSLQSLNDDPNLYGFYVAVGSSLDGRCKDRYASPAGSLLLTSGTNPVSATWKLVGPTPPPAPPQCGNKNACRHRWYDAKGIVWDYDLCGLCKERGEEYVWTDAFNHTFVYNVGATAGGTSGPGPVRGACTPPWTVYESTGIMRQFWTDVPSCAGGPDGTCTDPERGGQAVCCSGDCAVIAHLGATPTAFTPVDPFNPATSGVSLSYQGMPPDASDPFECSTDPTTGCAKSRSLTQRLYCDPSGSPDALTFLGISEPSQCQYLLEAKSKAACGSKASVEREL